MRKRLWKNVTTVFTTCFHLLVEGGESPRPTRYWRLQTCDKSHGVTLSSLNSDFLRRQIIKHHHKSLPAIFVSEKICSSDKIVTLRPILRPNSQPRGAHAKFVWRLRVWLLEVKHPPKTALSSSVDNFLVLLGARSKHLDQLVDGGGGDEGAHDPPPLLRTLCSFAVLQPHPHNLEGKQFQVRPNQ